jgi:hypothetical protein
MQDTWEETWEEAQRFVAPLQHSVQEIRIEQIKGSIDEVCYSDCFQVIARIGDARHKSGILEPSDTVMTRSKVAMAALVTTDPLLGGGEPAWVAQAGWHAKDVELLNPSGDVGRVWYLNDRTGSKYFSALHVPGHASKIAAQIWKPAAMRHICSVDEAPGIVAADLSATSRMEYHLIPLPHPMSGVVAKGIEFDQREALVLSQFTKLNLMIDGEKVQGQLIWMKSVLHPDFPKQGESETSEAVVPQAAYSSRATGGMLHSTVSRERTVTRKKRDMHTASRNLARADILVRGFLIFDSPKSPGNACVIAFGHEDPANSVLNDVGRMASYVGLGGMVEGTVCKQVKHMMLRLQDVVMPRGYAAPGMMHTEGLPQLGMHPEAYQ